MCIYIYIYIYIYTHSVLLYTYTLFVTTAITETLNSTLLGVTCFPPLPVPKSYTGNRTVWKHIHNYTSSLCTQTT